MSRTTEQMLPDTSEFEHVISDTEVTLNQISPRLAGASNARRKARLERGDDEPSGRRNNGNM